MARPSKINVNKSIPYQGSKQGISHWVLNNITTQLNPDKSYHLFDLFGGGGAITTEALEAAPIFGEVTYNELHEGVSALFNLLTLGSPAEKQAMFDKAKTFVAREDFAEHYNKPTAWGGLVKTCYSFSFNGVGYMYGKQIEDDMKECHDIVFSFDEGLIAKQGITLPESFFSEPDFRERKLMLNTARVKQAGRPYNYFTHINALKRLENLSTLTNTQNLTVTNKSYLDYVSFGNHHNPVVYCDAPYSNTAGYNNSGFNQQEYHDFLRTQTVNGVPTFVSEYTLDVEGYEEIASVSKVVIRKGAFKYNTEKIFWNGIN